MIDATQVVTQQSSSADASSAPKVQDGSNSTTSDSSFKDALHAASSNQTKSAQTETQQTSDKSKTEQTDEKDKTKAVDVNAAALAGATQVAAAVQTKPDVPAATQAVAEIQSAVETLDAAETKSSGQPQQASLADPLPTQQAVQQAVTQVIPQAADADTAQAQSKAVSADAATVTANAVTDQTVETQQNPVVITATAAASVAATTAETQPSVQVAGQIQTEQSAEQPNTDSKVEEKNTKSANTTTTRSGTAVAGSETKIPVDTVSVQWKLDPSSQTVQNVVSQATATALTDQMPDSKTDTKAAGQTDGVSGQTSDGQQAATTLGMQFGTQLEQTSQVTSATTSQDLPTRVIDQVVREVKLSRIDGRSNVVVKLNPPDLGAMRLQITQDATGITTHIQTANNQVRGLLEAHMPQLMDSLAKAGVQVDAVQVSVGTSFNAFAGGAQQQDAQANANQTRQQYASASNGRTGSAVAIADTSQVALGGSGQAGYSWLA